MTAPARPPTADARPISGVSHAHGRRGVQLVRTLHLIRKLDTGWQDVDQLAQCFAVTTRTIRRDVAFLRLAGFDVKELGSDVSDTGRIAWKLDEWPAVYDLTA